MNIKSKRHTFCTITGWKQEVKDFFNYHGVTVITGVISRLAPSYSSFKLSTGFATAARMACQLTVNMAMIIANRPVNINTCQGMAMR